MTTCLWTLSLLLLSFTEAWEPFLGSFSIPTSCGDQKTFNQGLMLCFNFNQHDARPLMVEAASSDPECAMMQWGVAYSFEPFINHPVITDRGAFENVSAAASLAQFLARNSSVTLKEAGLIATMAVRFKSKTNKT